MDKLDIKVTQKEAAFIAEVKAILNCNCTNRMKIAKFYHEYVNHMAAISLLVKDAELETPQGNLSSGS